MAEDIPIEDRQEILNFLSTHKPKTKKLEKSEVNILLLENAKSLLTLTIEEKVKKNKNLPSHKYYAIRNSFNH